MKTNRILVLGANLTDLAAEAIAAKRLEHPDNLFIALVHPGEEIAVQHTGCDTVMTFSDSLHTSRRNPFVQLLAARKLKASTALCIGERNLFGPPLLTLLSGAKNKLLYTSAARFLPLRWWSRALLRTVLTTFSDLCFIALTPFLWLIITAGLILEGWLSHRYPPQRFAGYVPAFAANDEPRVSIVIPSWNGIRLGILEPCLQSLLEVPGVRTGYHQVIVADDGSSDDTVARLRADYPWVHLVRSERNQGFIAAANHGAEHAKFPFLLFLNNDMTVTPGFLEPLLEAITRSSDIAAVSPCLLDNSSDAPQWGVTMGGVLGDHVYFWNEFENQVPGAAAAPLRAAYAIGGALLVRHECFRKCGGFDDLYAPHTWEDIDLSYRLWKMGYRVLYVPNSGVRHARHVSIRARDGLQRLTALHVRNQYLFLWKNITSRQIIAAHLKRFPRHVISRQLRGERSYGKGACLALTRFSRALRERRLQRRESWRHDEAILSLPKTEYEQALASAWQYEPKPRLLIIVPDLALVRQTDQIETELVQSLAASFQLTVIGFVRRRTTVEQIDQARFAEFTVIPFPDRSDDYNPLYLYPQEVLRYFSSEFDDRMKQAFARARPDVVYIHGLAMAQYAYHAGSQPVIIWIPHNDPVVKPLLKGTNRRLATHYVNGICGTDLHFIAAKPKIAALVRRMLVVADISVSPPANLSQRLPTIIATSLIAANNSKVRKGYLQN